MSDIKSRKLTIYKIIIITKKKTLQEMAATVKQVVTLLKNDDFQIFFLTRGRSN